LARAYQAESNRHEQPEVKEALEVLALEGARRMLAAALEDEVEAFLGRRRYERGKPFRGYRNGYHEPRQLTVGVGAVDVRVPRVADVPGEAGPFHSQIVSRYERASQNHPAPLCPPVPRGPRHGGLRAGVPRTGR